MGNFSQFKRFEPQMQAVLEYWQTTRRDPRTGLHVWHDQLETGCDDLVISTCPSPYSACWNPAWHQLTISAPDLLTFLHREHMAFAQFSRAWATAAAAEGPTAVVGRIEQARLERQAATHEGYAQTVADRLNDLLWAGDLGHYVAYNTTAQARVNSRVFLMALPLWAGLANASQAATVTAAVMAGDMLSAYGVRSTSSADPRYTNGNFIVPYSNWRGPIWVNANTMLALGFNCYNYTTLAGAIGARVVAALASDIRATGTWHECYSAGNGSGLAAPGFLSWDTLGAVLLGNLRNRTDPFWIAGPSVRPDTASLPL